MSTPEASVAVPQMPVGVHPAPKAMALTVVALPGNETVVAGGSESSVTATVTSFDRAVHEET